MPLLCDSNKADHPRGCGENIRTGAWKHHCAGSPPRMRGKPKRLYCRKTDTGITPADAGKTM